MNEEALAPIVKALFRSCVELVPCSRMLSLPRSLHPPPIPWEGGKINLLVSPLTVEINCWNLVPSKCYIHTQDINITNLKEPKWLHNGASSPCMTVAGHTKLAQFYNWKYFPLCSNFYPLFPLFFPPSFPPLPLPLTLLPFRSPTLYTANGVISYATITPKRDSQFCTKGVLDL